MKFIIEIFKIKTIYLLLSVLFSGCATIIDGDTQNLSFYSNEPSVNVEVNYNKCTTPCSVMVKKESTLNLSVRKGNNKLDYVYKGKNFYPSLTSQIGIYLFIPAVIDSATGAIWEYDVDDIYIYVFENSIRLYDLNHSAFAFSMNYYPELSTTYTTEHEKRIKELSKLSDLDSEHIQSRLKQTIEAVAFADIISKDTLAKIILKKYKDIKSNKDKYVKQMANELRFNETFMDRLITESSNANELVYNIYNYDLIQKVGDYCDYFYLDIVSEYSEGSGEYLSGLSELSGLSIKELLTIVEVTEDKASFIERVIKEMEVKGEN